MLSKARHSWHFNHPQLLPPLLWKALNPYIQYRFLIQTDKAYIYYVADFSLLPQTISNESIIN